MSRFGQFTEHIPLFSQTHLNRYLGTYCRQIKISVQIIRAELFASLTSCQHTGAVLEICHDPAIRTPSDRFPKMASFWGYK